MVRDDYDTMVDLEDGIPGQAVGTFEDERAFYVNSSPRGYALWFGLDEDPVEALDLFNRLFPISSLHYTEDGNAEHEVDPHRYDMYDFSDWSKVRALRDEVGLRWSEDEHEDIAGHEHFLILYSNRNDFDYGLLSFRPIDELIPEIAEVEQDDTVVRDVKDFALSADF